MVRNTNDHIIDDFVPGFTKHVERSTDFFM
jgi:hypothetical protein